MDCTMSWATRHLWACLAIVAALGPAGAEPSPAPQTCTLEAGESSTVSEIVDAETIRLADRSEVRLIGALAPRASDTGSDTANGDAQWPPERAAIAALSGLTLGKTVRLAYGGSSRSDRYGRRLAHLYIERDAGEPEWLQGLLLASGHARAYGLPGNFACAAELLAHEREARIHRRGLWANEIYRLKPASRARFVGTLVGRYERVIGRVRAVAVTRSATYLNFGDDYRTDFTAKIAKAVIEKAPDFASTLPALKGRKVIVRGWIERRNGPLIDVADPSQIELLQTDRDPTDPGSRQPSSGEDESLAPDRPAARQPNRERPAPSTTEPGALDL